MSLDRDRPTLCACGRYATHRGPIGPWRCRRCFLANQK